MRTKEIIGEMLKAAAIVFLMVGCVDFTLILISAYTRHVDSEYIFMCLMGVIAPLLISIAFMLMGSDFARKEKRVSAIGKI